MKIKLTPLDIQQQRFTIRFRGYNTSEVDSFLDQVADSFVAIKSENEILKEKIHQREVENQEHKSREESFKRVMLNSQQVLEEMKEGARKSSELLVAQAQVDADKIINSAHEKLAKLHDEINELKRQRVQFKTQLQSIIQTHSELIEIGNFEFEKPEDEDIKKLDYD
jgi:cell division initiation protein